MSKVESQHGVVVGGVYRHFKGKEYLVLGFVINSTNVWTAGSVCVRYRRVGGACEFVRLESEFCSFVPGPGRLRFTFVRDANEQDWEI